MKKLLKISVIALLLSALTITGFADDSMTTIKKFLWALGKYKHDSAVPSQIQLNGKIKKLCNFILNVDYMGRRAMRTNWNRMTPAQQTEYLSLLKQIVDKIVYKDASRQLNDMRITYRSAQALGGNRHKVTANVFIISERLDMKAEYILEQQGSAYKIIDIFFDGESLVEDYHMEFNRIINEHGITGRRQSLLNRMRRTLRQNVLDDARAKRRTQQRQQRRGGR